MIHDDRTHGGSTAPVTHDPIAGHRTPPLAVAADAAPPRGPLLFGLALFAAAAGVAVLVATRDRRHPAGGRLLAVAARAPTRGVRREARVRGFWAGVLASAGSAIAGTVARHLAEDLLETARRERAALRVARG